MIKHRNSVCEGALNHVHTLADVESVTIAQYDTIQTTSVFVKMLWTRGLMNPHHGYELIRALYTKIDLTNLLIIHLAISRLSNLSSLLCYRNHSVGLPTQLVLSVNGSHIIP